jgi:ferrochelatase
MGLEFIDSWHDHPRLIAAFAQRLASARAKWGSDTPVLFTAHSVPFHTIAAGDPYENQARETAQLVAVAAGLPESQWKFAFQSQGMSGGAWLGPTVEDTLTQISESGASRVLMQPIGFVCDHVEVLYDIDIAFRGFGSQLGLEVVRAESLNDSPEFIAALSDLARSGLTRIQATLRSGASSS